MLKKINPLKYILLIELVMNKQLSVFNCLPIVYDDIRYMYEYISYHWVYDCMMIIYICTYMMMLHLHHIDDIKLYVSLFYTYYI